MARVAPLVAALGGEVQGLTPREVLSDATKLSASVRDLARSLAVDVATVEFGSRWDLEAAGATLDWSTFPPAVSGAAGAQPAGGRAPALLDAIARVRAELADRVVIAASVTGPVLAGGELATAAKRTLAAVRALCEAGAGLIWLVEDGARPPEDVPAYVRALTPAVGTARFYRADTVLHLSGEAGGWLETVRRLPAAIACFDPERSPALTGGSRDFGVIVAPGARPSALATEPACVLITHDGELAGRVPARGLQAAAQALRP